MAIHFRPALPADAPRLAALIASFQALLTADPEGRGAEQFLETVSERAIGDYIASARYRYIVAEADGVLAGFVAVRDRSHLYHLFVAAAFQRKGLGRSLWEEARRQNSGEGAVERMTVNASRNAAGFYARLGFVQVSEPVAQHGVVFIPMRLGSVP